MQKNCKKIPVIAVKLFVAVSFIAFFALNVTSAEAATYYVKNGGNDSADGLSDEMAWATIGKLNTIDFASGDVINFRPGDTFNDTNLKLLAVTGTIAITIQGSDFDSRTISGNGKPKFDADAIPISWPTEHGAININNTNIPGTVSGLTIKDIQFEGQNVNNLRLIYVFNVDNVTADGIDADGYGGNTYQDGVSGVYTVGGTGHVEYKNCNLHNLGPSGTMPYSGIGEVYAFYVSKKSSGSISVHDNIVYNINADAIQIVGLHNLTSSLIYNNEFYNCGENAVDIKSSDGTKVYNNKFYRTVGFTGQGGIPGGMEYPLINIIASNEWAEHYPSDNNEIYDNYIYDNPGSDGISIDYTRDGVNCTGNKIYRNFIKNTKQGIMLGSGGINTIVYANIFVDSLVSGFYSNNGQSGNVLYNNTFVNNAGMGVILNLAYSNATIKNNVFYQTDLGDLILSRTAGTPVIDYNIYYNATAGAQNIISYSGTTYTEAQQSTWRAAGGGHANELFANPGLNNISSSQFWAASGSSAIVNTGASATGQLWDVGLNANSTWTPSININTLVGTDNGGRDMGVYEYQSAGDTTPPSVPQGLSVE